MKVYVIKGCLNYGSFIVNVYASKEKAIRSFNSLLDLNDGFTYYIGEYSVIE